MKQDFTSPIAIGDRVSLFADFYSGHLGKVVAVGFTASKVTYDVDLEIGGETLRNVDSTFVTPA